MQFRNYRAWLTPGHIFTFFAILAFFASPAPSANVSPAQTCSFTLASQNRSFPSIGGGGVVTITASNPQCAWTARSDAPWIKITSALSGTGSSELSFTVEPSINSRRGGLVIAGQVFPVRQEFNPCPQPNFPSLPIALPNGFGSSDAPDLLVRDFDMDGRADLLLTTINGSANIAHNNGNGGYDQPVAVAPTIGGNIRVADFNRDQKPDLVGLSSGRIRVALNTTTAGGAVSFATPIETVVDQSMSELVVGDFNRDGFVDVAGITLSGFPPNNQNIAVLAGDGAGGFGPPIVTFFATPQIVFPKLVTGDFNGDGSLDLAVSGNRNQVIILRGNGAGAFTVVPFLPESQGSVQTPDQLTVGDFNGDRKSDLATLRREIASSGNPGKREVAIYLADNNGGFSAPLKRLISYNTYIGRIIAEDFNNDGRAELLVANPNGVEVINTTTGGAPEAPVSYFVSALKTTFDPSAPIRVATGDFNNDGLPDIFAPVPAGSQPANLAPTAYAVLVAQSGGGFAAPRSAVLFDNSQNNASVSFSGAADFNGDGILDLLIRVFKTNGMDLIVRFGSGFGGFGEQTTLSVDQSPTIISGLDLNRDGRSEIIQLQFSGLTVYLNDGSGRFAPMQPVSIGANARLLSTGDFNTDGVPDLLVTSETSGPLLLAGNGQGGFSSSPLTLPPALANALSFIAGDFNGDGNLDLSAIIAPPVGLPMLITSLNDGQAHFSAPISQNLFFPQPSARTGDFNNDGRTDLILFPPSSTAVHVLLSRGNGRFGEMDGDDAIPMSFETNGEIQSLTPGDFNGDGVLDLIITRPNTGVATFLAGAGDGRFAVTNNQIRLFQNPGQIPAFIIVDFNEDGANDLLTLGGPAVTLSSALLPNRGACYPPTGGLAATSAASFRGLRLAGESIASAFGTNLAAEARVADRLPLPTTLGETSVRIKDNAGVESLAPLFFVSPQQLNLQIPSEASRGTAVVSVLRSGNTVATGAIEIVSTNPGLFSANADGQGVAAALALRIRQDGSQTYEPVAVFDQSQNKFVTLPIDLGPSTDQVFLILFGTGIRNRNPLSTAIARIGGENAVVSYAGAQGFFVALDQVNVLLSRSLAGRGEVGIELTVDGKTTNQVRINMK
ncbi:MAG TPA: FG-GAP-like repeat-containing protein [Blastocatellia bacterium]|nr:FG-GAP-like repeat-containing protein [Blastocatellia bacterium]